MSMFSFVTNCQTLFPGGSTILHSHQQRIRVPFAAHLECGLSVFRIFAILIRMWWYLIGVLICNSIMTYDVENLFICLFAICMSSLIRYLFRSFVHFLIGLFVFLLLSFKSYLFWITVLYQICILQIFFSQSVVYLLILLIFTSFRISMFLSVDQYGQISNHHLKI